MEALHAPLTLRRLAASAIAGALLASAASADRIVTTTGRVLEGRLRGSSGKPPSEPLDSKATYTLSLRTAAIEIPGSLIASFEVEGDMADYVPKDDREREMLEKGYVRYRGQWISKERYGQLLEKANEEAKARFDEIRKHSDWANAWTKETNHFVVRSNTSPELLGEYADLFEEFYTFFDRRLGIDPPPLLRRTKMKVNIFKNYRDYLDSSGAPEGTGGYFSDNEQSLNFYHDAADPAFTRLVMFHEGTHLLTYLINPQFAPPTWINEGMAEYFGSSSVEGPPGRRKIVPGGILDHRLLLVQQAIADQRTTPLETVLSTSQVEFNTPELYAYGWSFVHFLFTSAKYGKNFEKFFRDLYRGRGVKTETYGSADRRGTVKFAPPAEVLASLKRALGVRDFADVEAEYLRFVRDEMKAEEGRGHFALGRDLYFRSTREKDRSLDAIRHLTIAIEEKGYATAEAYFYRAMAHSAAYNPKRNKTASLDDIRKAIALDPVETQYRAYLAWLLTGDDKTREEAIRQLRIACEIDPLDAFLQVALEITIEGGAFWRR